MEAIDLEMWIGCSQDLPLPPTQPLDENSYYTRQIFVGESISTPLLMVPALLFSYVTTWDLIEPTSIKEI